MSIESILYRDILENPEDDTPRLIYADWLEDQGRQDRAEFIRLQIELHPYQRERKWLQEMPVEQWHGDEATGELLRRLHPLVQRETQLRRQYIRGREEWNHPFICKSTREGLLPSSRSWGWRWTRGFVTAVTLPLRDFLERAPTLFSQHPIDTIRIADRWPKYSSGLWLWSLPTPTDIIVTTHHLPEILLRAMDSKTSDHPYATRSYGDYDSAIAALSQVCVAHGRDVAGLPPLGEGHVRA